jgi:hypothetical protein
MGYFSFFVSWFRFVLSLCFSMYLLLGFPSLASSLLKLLFSSFAFGLLVLLILLLFLVFLSAFAFTLGPGDFFILFAQLHYPNFIFLVFFYFL